MDILWTLAKLGDTLSTGEEKLDEDLGEENQGDNHDDFLLARSRCRPATKPEKNLGRVEQKSTTIYLYYGSLTIDIYIIA